MDVENKDKSRYRACLIVILCSVVMMVAGVFLMMGYTIHWGQKLLLTGFGLLILSAPLAIISAIVYAVKDRKNKKAADTYRVKKNKWADPLFIGMFFFGTIVSGVLAMYVLGNPNSFLGKTVFAVAEFFGKSGEDKIPVIAFGAFFFTALINLAIYAFILKPVEIFGKKFWKSYWYMLRSLNPLSSTAKFNSHYEIAKLSLEAMKEEAEPVAKEYYAVQVQERLDRMMDLDPDSPLVKEIADEFYDITTVKGSDTPISSEIKQWEKLPKEMDKDEADFKKDEKRGKRSYVYAGVAGIFTLALIMMGLDALFNKGAVLRGIVFIFLGVGFAPRLFKACWPYRKKRT